MENTGYEAKNKHFITLDAVCDLKINNRQQVQRKDSYVLVWNSGPYSRTYHFKRKLKLKSGLVQPSMFIITFSPDMLPSILIKVGDPCLASGGRAQHKDWLYNDQFSNEVLSPMPLI